MSQISELLKAVGLVDAVVVQEFTRWGMPNVGVTPDSDAPLDFSEALQKLHEALEENAGVDMKETDLNAVRQFFDKRRIGTMVLSHGGQSGSTEVAYAVSLTGEYMFPFKATSFTDLVANGESYLLADGKKIFLRDPRELYYGGTQVFVSYTPWVEP